MATTTNYGWTTPDNTALVKDGAAAIRSLGSSIDTTLKAQIDAQIPDSLLTTKGDLISATAASTPARLGVGTNGQVLLADSTASTGLAWGTPASGSMTLLSTTSLTGTSVTVSSISQSYKNVMFRFKNVYTSVNERYLQIRFNSDTSANYWDFGWYDNNTYTRNAAETAFIYYNVLSSTNSTTNTLNGQFIMSDYTSTGVKIGTFILSSDVGGGQTRNATIANRYIGTSAISSITVATNGSPNSFSGGTLEIWGIN